MEKAQLRLGTSPKGVKRSMLGSKLGARQLPKSPTAKNSIPSAHKASIESEHDLDLERGSIAGSKTGSPLKQVVIEKDKQLALNNELVK